MERGSGIDEETEIEGKDLAEGTETSPEENGDMPVETVKVVGLRKVPGQPLGLTVSYFSLFIVILINIRSSFPYL